MLWHCISVETFLKQLPRFPNYLTQAPDSGGKRLISVPGPAVHAVPRSAVVWPLQLSYTSTRGTASSQQETQMH